MDLTPKFATMDIRNATKQMVIAALAFIENELNYIGLEFVREARIKADFTDRTGNLRSSIGYLLLKDGKVLNEDFEPSGSGTDKASGVTKGAEYAIEIAKAQLGYVLVVVAGMEYAVFVEARGYDVLTSSSFKADAALEKAMVRIKSTFQ